MPQQSLRSQGTGPAAEKGEQLQSAFLRSPFISQRGGFVESVGKEGHDTGNNIENEDCNRKAANDNCNNDKPDKAKRKCSRDITTPRRSRLGWFLTNKCNAIGLRSALAIDNKFVSYEFVSLWPTLAIGKGTDMDEGLFTATIGRDESKALVILPCGDSALVSHDKFLNVLMKGQVGVVQRATGDRRQNPDKGF